MKYENEEYLKREIMEQSRHQFIYGYDGNQRKKFLENVASCYPIVLDKDFPMAIYVTEIGLPRIPICDCELNKNRINLMSSQFLYFSIASDILSKIKATSDIDIINEKIKRLIKILNKCSINRDYSPIVDFDDLSKILIESKEFYKKYYLEYCGKGIETASINDIALPFIDLDMFVRYLKEAINNDSYFGIIIDKQNDIALTSSMAINGLVGMRINGDISMKIAVQPDNWDIYRNLNGQLIEYVHDYGIVELDESQSMYMKKLTRHNNL